MTSVRPWTFSNGMPGLQFPGDGETVLWVHGYTMDSSLWQPLWERLPAWRHLGIDWLRGPADSPRTLPEMARSIAQQAVDQRARHLVGLSFGAILALQAAAECPDDFDTLTLGSAGLTGGPEAEHARQRYMELIEAFRNRGVGPWLTKIWLQSPPDIFTGAAAHPDLWQALEASIDRHPWRELTDGSMHRLTQYRQVDHLDTLARTRAATLLMVGEHEMPAFVEAAAQIQTALPNCTTQWLASTGHLCLLEDPAESAHRIAQHLQQNPSNLLEASRRSDDP